MIYKLLHKNLYKFIKKFCQTVDNQNFCGIIYIKNDENVYEED